MSNTNWFTWWNSLTHEEKCEYNHEMSYNVGYRCPRAYRHSVYQEEGRDCMYCDFKAKEQV